MAARRLLRSPFRPGNPAANPTPTLRTSPGPAFPQTPFGAATNTFIRHYLPRYDETPTTAAAPYAPYAMQSATPLAGDPPVVGIPAYYAVLVTVVNPDPVNAMTNVALTAPVPAPAQYVTAGTNVNGPARATGGGVVGTCGAPCSGNITSTWASIPANSAVTLSYAVKVTAAAVGQRLYLTGGPAVRGGGRTRRRTLRRRPARRRRLRRRGPARLSRARRAWAPFATSRACRAR